MQRITTFVLALALAACGEPESTVDVFGMDSAWNYPEGYGAPTDVPWPDSGGTTRDGETTDTFDSTVVDTGLDTDGRFVESDLERWPTDLGSPQEDTATPDPDLGMHDPDLGTPDPDMGTRIPDLGTPDPDVGSSDLDTTQATPDISSPPPCTECGPDQICQAGTCVPACQGGCGCLPPPDACPNPPGGGVTPGAQTPNEYGALAAHTSVSGHWGACHDGDEVACHLFLREWVLTMYQKDPNWGLLSKTPGQNQCTLSACGNGVACGYAADAIIYRATNQVIDIITGIGAPGSNVAWQLVGKLATNNWAPPTCLPGSTTPGASDTLESGEGLAAGQKRVSTDGRFQLEYQSDGDLVLSFLGVGPLWSSGTKSAPGAAQMQGDGNLVVYDANGTPLWASDTAGNEGAKLVLQNDGNAVMYNGSGTPIWATNTCCY